MPHVDVNGLRLYYEWHGAGPGPPLVLVMGLGADSTAWAFQLAAFARTRRCLVLDNRGVGQSDAPDPPYAIRDMAADLIALLDAIGVERLHLLGVSMGGAIAQEAALAQPDRLASLQLHSTWAGPDPWFHAVVRSFRMARREFGQEAFLRSVMPWVLTPACYAERPNFVELIIQRGVAHPHPPPLRGYLGQVDAVLGHDARARLGGIRCPTLVTVGSDDLLTSPRFARELAALIPGARLETIPSGGHGCLWEHPESFNAACLAFLARVGRA